MLKRKVPFGDYLAHLHDNLMTAGGGVGDIQMSQVQWQWEARGRVSRGSVRQLCRKPEPQTGIGCEEQGPFCVVSAYCTSGTLHRLVTPRNLMTKVLIAHFTDR